LLAVLEELQLWFAAAIVGALGDLGDGGGEAERKAEAGDKDSIFIIVRRRATWAGALKRAYKACKHFSKTLYIIEYRRREMLWSRGIREESETFRGHGV